MFDNTIYNVTYNKCPWSPIYKQMNLEEAISLHKKEDFKCFQFRHLGSGLNMKTQFRMIYLKKFGTNISVNEGDWQ